MATKHPTKLPPQHQDHQPGHQEEMKPPPQTQAASYRGSGKLRGKSALITGGDSGIGRAVAVLYAREGADVAIVYLEEQEDARTTSRLVKEEGQQCLTIKGDVGKKAFCEKAVQKVIDAFGRLDILVNNAAVQYEQERLEDVSEEQLEKTFRTNIYGYIFMTQAALPHLKKGSTIINTTSITAFRGHPTLIDYASTKGAILAFTRSLSQNLADKGIRVNSVAPGPIWTPLIPASFSDDHVESFGQDTPLGRPGQPEEVAPSYVFLASEDSSYMVGQTLHPNGGEVVGA
jgi:NAD(P)-dependent dehydrogenase (short-subunit alcohol dehydrogenase family)